MILQKKGLGLFLMVHETFFYKLLFLLVSYFFLQYALEPEIAKSISMKDVNTLMQNVNFRD